MRYTKTIDWFTMWKNDKDSIIVTMHNNLTADLNCGYNPTGLSIRSQMEMIDSYVKEYSDTTVGLTGNSSPYLHIYL